MDTTPHLLIEAGPETGRELTIPAKGARLGRASENDISIADPAMSRFQCRMYFRDNFLHVMDLGSTNETLVNDEPKSDTILRFGDKVLIGDTELKVIFDGYPEEHKEEAVPPAIVPEKEPEPAPAPIVFQPDAPPSRPAAAERIGPETEDVDLGLGKRDPYESKTGGEEKRSVLPLILVALVTMIVVVGIGLAVMMSTAPASNNGTPTQARAHQIRVVYEKVISGEGNVFRYAVELAPNGQLLAEVHDLRQERDITRDEVIAPERLRPFQDQLAAEKDMFLALQDTYEGLPVGDHESYRLTVVFGREAKTVHVANQLEPDAFKQVREQIESYANNELGLINIEIPPEELRARAEESWQNAQDLYAQREVKNDNLWQASQKLKDVAFLLETIEPKPEYYEQAVVLRQQWNRQLDDKIRDLEFEAIRSMQVGDTRRAAELNQRILATRPDRTHTEYKEAYNRLVQIEQELR